MLDRGSLLYDSELNSDELFNFSYICPVHKLPLLAEYVVPSRASVPGEYQLCKKLSVQRQTVPSLLMRRKLHIEI